MRPTAPLEKESEALKTFFLANPHWKLSPDASAIYQEFQFPSFADAIDWMVQVARHCDPMDHHPDWCNSYKKVRVNLKTHDINGLSTLDLSLAALMQDEFNKRFSCPTNGEG